MSGGFGVQQSCLSAHRCYIPMQQNSHNQNCNCLLCYFRYSTSPLVWPSGRTRAPPLRACQAHDSYYPTTQRSTSTTQYFLLPPQRQLTPRLRTLPINQPWTVPDDDSDYARETPARKVPFPSSNRPLNRHLPEQPPNAPPATADPVTPTPQP